MKSQRNVASILSVSHHHYRNKAGTDTVSKATRCQEFVCQDRMTLFIVLFVRRFFVILFGDLRKARIVPESKQFDGIFTNPKNKVMTCFDC